MRSAHPSRPDTIVGFTLIELMMTLVILAILAAIAIPSYSEFVTRSRLIDAHTKLGDLRIQMEKYFQDNRTYVGGGGACGADVALANYNADPARAFEYSCPAVTATTYVLQADGRSAKGMTGFVFTVNEANAKSSAGPTGWTAAANCWLVRKSGECS